MSDQKWLKTARVDTVVESVRSHGVITFFGNGLSDMENAELATRVIDNIAKRNVTLATFFLGSVKSDDSYQSVKFEVGHTVGIMTVIYRRTVYHQIAGMPDREDSVIKDGPVVPTDKAQAICDLMNS